MRSCSFRSCVILFAALGVLTCQAGGGAEDDPVASLAQVLQSAKEAGRLSSLTPLRVLFGEDTPGFRAFEVAYSLKEEGVALRVNAWIRVRPGDALTVYTTRVLVGLDGTLREVTEVFPGGHEKRIVVEGRLQSTDSGWNPTVLHEVAVVFLLPRLAEYFPKEGLRVQSWLPGRSSKAKALTAGLHKDGGLLVRLHEEGQVVSIRVDAEGRVDSLNEGQSEGLRVASLFAFQRAVADETAKAAPAKGGQKETEKTPQVAKAMARMRALGKACELYRLEVGFYPGELEDLFRAPPNAQNWGGPYVQGSLNELKDPWGGRYAYTRLLSSYTLVSFGADGAPGGAETDADLTYTP